MLNNVIRSYVAASQDILQLKPHVSQSDKISHIDMEDDHIDNVISHIISPYRSPISISDHILSL